MTQNKKLTDILERAELLLIEEMEKYEDTEKLGECYLHNFFIPYLKEIYNDLEKGGYENEN